MRRIFGIVLISVWSFIFAFVFLLGVFPARALWLPRASALFPWVFGLTLVTLTFGLFSVFRRAKNISKDAGN